MRVIVKLNSIEKIKKFIKINEKQSFDIDIGTGRYLVDGKSIMGIFSLNLNEPIYVNVHGGNQAEYSTYIKALTEADLFMKQKQ